MTRPFPTTIPEAARQLDEVSPGWEHKINLENLQMWSQSFCPLGQIFGNYHQGKLNMWGVTDLLPLKAAKLFSLPSNEDAWKHEINKRRMPTVNVQKYNPKFQLGQRVIIKQDGNDMPTPREITGMAIDGAGPEMEFRCGNTWYREDKITDLPTFKAEKEATFRRYMESLDTIGG